MKTKDKIILASINLFNANGIVNITLRDLADEVGISVGNLAYHFNRKDEIVLAVYDQMIEELNVILSQLKLIPSFENINQQMDPLVAFQKRFKFFYLDTIEITRAYPTIAEKHEQQIEFQIEYIRAMMDYAVGVDNLVKATDTETYSILAQTIWQSINFWFHQDFIRSKVTRRFEIRDVIWNLMLPYLTAKGKQHLEKVFFTA